MENVLLARKDWSNAAAFVEFNPATNQVRVYGKFYDERGRGHSGPTTEWLETVPEELQEEVKGRGGWREPMSPELSAFCKKVFTKGKEAEPWFRY